MTFVWSWSAYELHSAVSIAKLGFDRVVNMSVDWLFFDMLC